MTINSKQKGARGEREVADILRKHGFDARRSAQYCGNTGDAADITSNLPYHIEVKHQERIEIDKWWDQAVHDAKENGKDPILVFRKNKQKWRVVMDFEKFLELQKISLVKSADCGKVDLTEDNTRKTKGEM